MDYATLLQMLDATLRLATPLLLACLAGLYSERAGGFDIGLEGKMLMAAMSSAAVAALTGAARFAQIDLPFAESLRAVPILGPFYAEVLSGHTILVYVALLLVPLTWWVLFRTRFGLRLRAVGENPASVDTAGVSVVRLRYTAVLITGVLCGLAGA